MIVIIIDRFGDETIHEGIAAAVRNRSGFLYLCRDGQPDEYIDDNSVVTVVNDG